MIFQKGRKKSGGRVKGTPNKATESIKNVLNVLLPEDELAALWETFLVHKDPHIAFEAFKLANYYMFGKTATIVTGAEELPPVKIDISAIPSNVSVSRLDIGDAASERRDRLHTLLRLERV